MTSSKMKVKRLGRHKKNLAVVTMDGQQYVRSYETLVAKIIDDDMIVQNWWSRTTDRHIYYASRVLSKNLIRLYQK